MAKTVETSVWIDADPGLVWAHVSDPVLESGWNQSIQGVERAREGDPVLGERFVIVFERGGRSYEAEVEVLGVDPGRRLESTITLVHGRRKTMTETVEVEPEGNGTRIRIRADLTGLYPWPLNWLHTTLLRASGGLDPLVHGLKTHVESFDAVDDPADEPGGAGERGAWD